MSTKNSIQEKKELEKFIKFLALKCTQVIVQSRLGEKIQTYSSQHTSGNDWVSVLYTMYYNKICFSKLPKKNKIFYLFYAK